MGSELFYVCCIYGAVKVHFECCEPVLWICKPCFMRVMHGCGIFKHRQSAVQLSTCTCELQHHLFVIINTVVEITTRFNMDCASYEVQMYI